MQLDLTRYRQPEAEFVRTFQPQDVAGEGDAYRIVAPVELSFRILKDKNAFRLIGRVVSALELECSRCLEPYGLPVDAAFDLRYLPATVAADLAAEREIAEDDLGTSYYREDQIDLNELLREQFYLGLPMKPLCQADCRGLCASCGTNRNSDTCACAPVWEDTRLAALRNLAKVRES